MREINFRRSFSSIFILLTFLTLSGCFLFGDIDEDDLAAPPENCACQACYIELIPIGLPRNFNEGRIASIRPATGQNPYELPETHQWVSKDLQPIECCQSYFLEVSYYDDCGSGTARYSGSVFVVPRSCTTIVKVPVYQDWDTCP